MTTLARYVAALRNCGLRSSDRVAVALSGGPDSLALASMTVWWQGFVRNQVLRRDRLRSQVPPAGGCRGQPAALHPTAVRPRARAATRFPLQQTPLALIVDHKLRPESTEEAHAVAAQVQGCWWHACSALHSPCARVLAGSGSGGACQRHVTFPSCE